MGLGKLRPFLTILLIAIGSWVIVGILWLLGLFQGADLNVYDHMVRQRAGAGTVDPRIVVVLVTEGDITKYDYPLHDARMAQLLSTIEQDRPCVVGLDIYRDLPQPRDGSELLQLNQVLATYGNIICIFKFGQWGKARPDGPVSTPVQEWIQTMGDIWRNFLAVFQPDAKDEAPGPFQRFEIPPPPILAKSSGRIGFNDFVFDQRTIRRGFIFLTPGDKDLTAPQKEPARKPQTSRSLAWWLACFYLHGQGINPATEGQSVRLGKSLFKQFRGSDGGYVRAPNGGYQYLFDYKGPQTFTSYTLDQVLTGAAAGAFTNKIVLIGAGSVSSDDLFSTPLRSDDRELGVIIHAQAVNQFLRAAIDGDEPTVGVGKPTEFAIFFLWSAIATLVGYFCRSILSFSAALLLCLAQLFLSAWILFLGGLWFAPMSSAAAILLAAIGVKAYTAQSESAQRAALMRLFAQNQSTKVANYIWSLRDGFVAGQRPPARDCTATVLFTDIQGYSTISEKLPSDPLMGWITEYLGALSIHVERNDGFVNKFMGDAIMAVFGVLPLRKEAKTGSEKKAEAEAVRADAIHAVQCALDMREKLTRLNVEWQKRGLLTFLEQTEVVMRIGIYTGQVKGGFVGDLDRLEFTTIGDATNTAARLESVDKDQFTPEDGCCRILIGDTTYERVKDLFEIEPMGEGALKGQSRVTVYYRVLRRKAEVSLKDRSS